MNNQVMDNRKNFWRKSIILNMGFVVWAAFILYVASTLKNNETLEPRSLQDELDLFSNQLATVSYWSVIIFDIFSLFFITNYNSKKHKYAFVNTFSLLFLPSAVIIFGNEDSLASFLFSVLACCVISRIWENEFR